MRGQSGTSIRAIAFSANRMGIQYSLECAVPNSAAYVGLMLTYPTED